MEQRELNELLEAVAQGTVSAADAAVRLETAPVVDLGYARVDNQRGVRRGVSEVVYGAGKTPDQIAGIVASMLDQGEKRVLVTRIDADAAREVEDLLSDGLTIAPSDAATGVDAVQQAATEAMRTGADAVRTGAARVSEAATAAAKRFGASFAEFADAASDRAVGAVQRAADALGQPVPVRAESVADEDARGEEAAADASAAAASETSGAEAPDVDAAASAGAPTDSNADADVAAAPSADPADGAAAADASSSAAAPADATPDAAAEPADASADDAAPENAAATDEPAGESDVPDLPVFTYYDLPQVALVGEMPEPTSDCTVVVCSGGTSDIPVAEEAALTAEVLGCRVERLYDVGVAGLHRLLAHVDELERATAIVAVAGMEGALPSVVAGLASCPVIAVPTSVGYGASFGGVSALLSMLNSCAAGVSVVNIDNGFGAGYQAALIVRAADES